MASQGREASTAAPEMRILVLPATSADGVAVQKVLGHSGLPCEVVASLPALCEAIEAGAGTVLVSEEPLLTEPALLCNVLRGQAVWSDLPLLVLSRTGRPSPALEPLLPQLGNISLVERPVQTLTLISVIRSSLRARSRQYQVREHLARQQETQRAIREGEQRYGLLIENIRDYAIFMIDLDGQVGSWNSGAQHILGYSSEEILGQPAKVFFGTDEPSQRALEREMQDARAMGRTTSTGWRVRKDGERMFVEGALTAVRDDTGTLVGYAKFMKDVTDRQRMEAEREQLFESERAARAEAERSGRMKDEFLATLGHELRTPLNAVLGWSQVLRRSPGLTAEVTEGLTVIERNARSQAQIIEDLLDMSAIISGKARLDVQRVDLAAVVEATIKTIKPAADAKGIRLQVVLDPLARAVSGDPNRLQQVFWNLLTNAVKFTPKGGRVSVTLERVNSHLEVGISDTGEGIDPAFLPHVFDRFRQADATSARRHGGLGLGLSIVKQLIELHGGTVTAKSAGPGEGATFRVTLPVMATNAHPLEDTSAREHPGRSAAGQVSVDVPRSNLRGALVLVVDDDPDARALVQRLLEDCNAQVQTASSAAQALDHIARKTPDVLVSDIGMPSEDGYSLIRRIRALTAEKGRIPAIALTAYARVEDRIKTIQAGYQLHLSKPVEPMELIAMIESLIKRSPE